VLNQAAFMGASWMLVGMRHKEEVSILPITVLAYSIVIYAVANQINVMRNQIKAI
jgi:hypothetical protein